MAVEQGTHRVEVYKNDGNVEVHSTLMTNLLDSGKQRVSEFPTLEDGINEKNKDRFVHRFFELTSLGAEIPPIGVIVATTVNDFVSLFQGKETSSLETFLSHDLTSLFALILFVMIKQYSREGRIKAEQEISTMQEALQTEEASVARTYPFKL